VSLTVAYGALATGIIVWLVLVRLLSTKSWLAQGTVAVEAATIEPPRPVAARVGLWIFLAVVTSLFGLFISAYYMRMGHGGQMATDWKPFPEPLILWINTALLLLGSSAMQWARSSVARGNADRTRTALLTGGVLTLAFLVGQFLAWRLMVTTGYFMPSNPAVAFFYLLTGVHGLHLLGGLYVWGRTVLRLSRKDRELIDVRLSVELCTVYWHYLLVVWLVLFALLLSHSIDSQLIFERLC
jgi:cytochrome c oxidase subunit 3